MTETKPFRSLLFVLPLLFWAASGSAGWVAEGAPVCTAIKKQVDPSGISDRAGGAIVVWRDERRPFQSFQYWGIYAQRFDADGNAMWLGDGILVADTLHGDFTYQLIEDGQGGAIIVWDSSTGAGLAKVYAQRLSSDGSLLWGAQGVRVVTRDGQWYPQVVSDGAGGAIVAWRDPRPAFGSRGIYAQRVGDGGSRLWLDTGVPVCTADGDKGPPAITSDSAGGAVISWQDSRDAATDGHDRIYAQRISGLGVTRWTNDGLPMTLNPTPQSSPRMVSDSTNGAIVIWRDERNGKTELYGQRISGSALFAWGYDGLEVAASATDVTSYFIDTDGSGGVMATWTEEQGDAYVQHVISWGELDWGPSGTSVCTAAGAQYAESIVTDGSGGAILSWRDHRNESSTSADIYVQRFDDAGAALWSTNGVPVCTATAYQSSSCVVPDGFGGAVAAWRDDRNSTDPLAPNADIYAQWVDGSGIVAPSCAVSPTTLDFREVAVGSYSDLSFTITNTGVGDLSGTVGEACTHFSIVAGNGAYALGTGQSRAVTVRYAPSAVGAHQCQISTGLSLCGQVSCNGIGVVLPDWAQLISPQNMTVNTSDPSPSVYGSVRADGVTTTPGPSGAISAELGYGPPGSDPAADGSWQWIAASFTQDVGDVDEYAAVITPYVAGEYDYCYRFAVNGGPWLYGDLDGSDNGYAANQAGALTVVDPCAGLGSIVYVDAHASGLGNGTSWANAVTELNDALALAVDCPGGDEVWVAAGTYYPTDDTDRTVTFEMSTGLAVYGGFAGDETLRSQRNWKLNQTILSGDIGVVDYDSDNSYCVVTGNSTIASSVLDGFTISGANGIGAPQGADVGGVFLGVEGSMTLANLIITRNAADAGAGMSVISFSVPSLTDVVFSDNFSNGNGGALVVAEYSSPTLTNVIFEDNLAVGGGGAVHVSGFFCNPRFINTAFFANVSASNGGAVYVSDSAAPAFINASFSENDGDRGGALFITSADATLRNSVLWGDTALLGGSEIYLDGSVNVVSSYCLIEGCGDSGAGWDPSLGTDGGSNFDDNPQFKGGIEGVGHALWFWSFSPLIDAGNNADVPAGVGTDLRGGVRIYNAEVVDIGAYELQGTVTAVDDDELELPTRIVLYQNTPNPFNPMTKIQYSLPQRAPVTLVVYDLSGRVVRSLLDGTVEEAGQREVIWDGRDDRGRRVSSAVYFYSFRTPDYQETRRMLLLK